MPLQIISQSFQLTDKLLPYDVFDLFMVTKIEKLHTKMWVALHASFAWWYLLWICQINLSFFLNIFSKMRSWPWSYEAMKLFSKNKWFYNFIQLVYLTLFNFNVTSICYKGYYIPIHHGFYDSYNLVVIWRKIGLSSVPSFHN